MTRLEEATGHEATEQQVSRLRALSEIVSQVCEEAGCSCLAQKFERLAQNPVTEGTCPASKQHHEQPTAAMLQFVCKLGPLAKALVDAGYHDIALLTVELAFNYEPTADHDLARAYLYVILGETEEAAQIYKQRIDSCGTLPRAELEKLAKLVQTHTDEEDIHELYSLLKPYAVA